MENISIRTGSSTKKKLYIIWAFLFFAFVVYLFFTKAILSAIIILVFTFLPILLFFNEHFKKIELFFHKDSISIQENTILKELIEIKIG